MVKGWARRDITGAWEPNRLLCLEGDPQFMAPKIRLLVIRSINITDCFIYRMIKKL